MVEALSLLKNPVALLFQLLNNVADIFEDHSPKIKKTKVVIEYGKPIYPNQLDKETKKNLAGYVSDQIKDMYFKNQSLV